MYGLQNFASVEAFTSEQHYAVSGFLCLFDYSGDKQPFKYVTKKTTTQSIYKYINSLIMK